MNKESTIVIDLAKDLMELARRVERKWEKAFFRFSAEENAYGSNASFVAGATVMIIDQFKNSNMFRDMNAKGASLLKLLGKKQAVFILIVDSNHNYDIKFEFEALKRWKITKLDGGNGIPEGI